MGEEALEDALNELTEVILNGLGDDDGGLGNQAREAYAKKLRDCQVRPLPEKDMHA